MLQAKGIYSGGNTVQLEEQNFSVNEPYEVVVTFVQPLGKPQTDMKQKTEENPIDKDLERRREGFKRFSKYQGTLPPDFDYKKEFFEYLDERYDPVN